MKSGMTLDEPVDSGGPDNDAGYPCARCGKRFNKRQSRHKHQNRCSEIQRNKEMRELKARVAELFINNRTMLLGKD